MEEFKMINNSDELFLKTIYDDYMKGMKKRLKKLIMSYYPESVYLKINDNAKQYVILYEFEYNEHIDGLYDLLQQRVLHVLDKVIENKNFSFGIIPVFNIKDNKSGFIGLKIFVS